MIELAGSEEDSACRALEAAKMLLVGDNEQDTECESVFHWFNFGLCDCVVVGWLYLLSLVCECVRPGLFWHRLYE